MGVSDRLALVLARTARVGLAVSVSADPLATSACVEILNAFVPLLRPRGMAVGLAMAYAPRFASALLPRAYCIDDIRIIVWSEVIILVAIFVHLHA